MKILSLVFILTATCLLAFDENEAQTFARFVPERADDFAWENDLIAFRAYGPALLDGAENSGIDCWLKRVKYPIIDKWYKLSKEGVSYHKDHGEGLDNYHVGSSAGTGGTAIWLNGKREALETFVKYKLLESSTKLTRFKLFYKYEIAGSVYEEEKTIMIELGKRLFSAISVFKKDGEIAVNLPICIGVTKHDGKAESFSDQDKGWIACWEKLDGSGLGTAVMMTPQRIEKIEVVNSKVKDESHIFIIAKTDKSRAIAYHAGYGWEKAGAITTLSDWTNYLNQFALQLAD